MTTIGDYFKELEEPYADFFDKLDSNDRFFIADSGVDESCKESTDVFTSARVLPKYDLNSELIHLKNDYRLKIWTIGRIKSNDIVIYDCTVSSMHARMDQVDNNYYIVDADSKNGTQVNGEKIGANEPYLLPELPTIITFGICSKYLFLTPGRITAFYRMFKKKLNYK